MEAERPNRSTPTSEGRRVQSGARTPLEVRSARLRFGIAGKLLAAFGAIAGLTVLATVVAWIVFDEFRDNLTIITTRSLPATVTSFELAERSAEVGAGLPQLAAAQSETEAQAAWEAVQADIDSLAALTATLGDTDGRNLSLAAFTDIVEYVRANVGLLRDAVLRALRATRERQDTVGELFESHQEFIAVITPMIDATRDETLVATRRSVSEGTSRIGSLIDNSFEALRAVLEVRTSVNEIAANMNQIAAMDDLALVHDRRIAIVGSLARIRTVIQQIPPSEDAEALAEIVAQITALAFAEDNIFKLREQTLDGSAGRAAEAAALLERRMETLNEARERFREIGESMVAALDGEVLVSAADAWRESELIVARTQRGLSELESILFLHSDVNRLVSLLSEASTVQSEAELPALRVKFRERLEDIEGDFRALDLDLDVGRLDATVDEIVRVGTGDRSIFAVRLEDLRARSSANALVSQSQTLIFQLSERAQQFVDAAAKSARESSEKTLASLGRGEFILVAIVVASLAGAVLITWLYVFRQVIGRLSGLSLAMNAIADGNLDTPVNTSGNDEIADMADALKVFRENAVQRRRAELALRESEERYALAFQGSTDAVWDVDLRTDRAHYSERYWTMLGYEPEEISEHNMTVAERKSWTERIHPADRAQVQSLMRDHLDGKTESYEAIFRFQCKNGDWIWILSRGGALRDGYGTPYRITGTHTDISERIRLEEQLRQAKERAEETLAELEDAQANLVQAEKMASLGQLTAGIAHEIKNPLNFVNNFSSLSMELIEELRDELEEAAGEDAELPEEVEDLLGVLATNLTKIVEHGKRADSIVRGMLDHSRASTGRPQPTNLNGLLKEFANLAYHGLRAQSPGFNVTIEYDLDDSIGTITVSPQDLSRVFLNIVTNAFHATQKRKEAGDQDYSPTVTFTTRKLGDRVEIRIRDNGTGMPKNVCDKIFEPFFTTKPPGEGTGLGLSISYDIVVQQHGGSLGVVSAPGEFTEFVITLPLTPAAEEDGGEAVDRP